MTRRGSRRPRSQRRGRRLAQPARPLQCRGSPSSWVRCAGHRAGLDGSWAPLLPEVLTRRQRVTEVPEVQPIATTREWEPGLHSTVRARHSRRARGLQTQPWAHRVRSTSSGIPQRIRTPEPETGLFRRRSVRGSNLPSATGSLQSRCQSASEIGYVSFGTGPGVRRDAEPHSGSEPAHRVHQDTQRIITDW